ncbi:MULTISPECIES: BamA/TamA family outer membrane protein [Tenacibaculum]|uniref:outer membrane protein assembly factor n=1 Tax=Tenacibaculum TaxID=104267 RepID=UPI001F0B68E9|nr:MULTISPECIES: outer membrane protein assembly factor [Tenacibaculum]MCH3880914.1 outer membrane protein assembly factor [Tenacibaculum aquimarinum]MDO6599486.1 outer membrane protein assembly factor [Tenacibaculum sp. 1_MG-2023]
MRCFLIIFLSFTSLVYTQEKTVYEVEFIGIKKTKTTFLEALISTQKDKPLDSLQLNKDVILLKRLPAISNANYKVIKGKENSYSVSFNIEENFTIIPETGFWTSANNQFSYKIGLYDYNFLGRNITLGGFYQNNGYNTYGANFKAPNLFSNKFGLVVSYQNWKSEEPLYFDNTSANYLYNNTSYEVLGLYQVNFKNEINFGVNIFNEKYEYISGATNPSVPQNLDVDKMLYKFVYTYNNLDYFYQYVNGFKSVFYGQYVSSDNEFQNNFLIFWNDFFYYKRVGEKGNWANRLRVGLSSNKKTPFAPFALDNNVNLRGVGILVDRGTGSIVLNTEYRHTFYDKKKFAIQGNAFIDSGTWRNPGGDLNDFFKSENVRIYSGVGLRLSSKKIYNATFRIDYGFSLKDKSGGLVFGVGQYF